MTGMASLPRRIWSEPTVHFAVGAALLFVFAAMLKPRAADVVEIDRVEVELRIKEIERGRGSALTSEERALAESAYIDEQVLARAARSRGLDDDERIRGILYQKMLQVLSSSVIQPSEAELQTFYAERGARYARPATVTVEEFAERADGPSQPSVLERVSERELSWAFDDRTAASIMRAAAGERVGRFRVIERFEPAPPPPFESIRAQIRFDWIAEKEEQLLKTRVQELRQQYAVRFVDEKVTP
jgi:hypothetical protein